MQDRIILILLTAQFVACIILITGFDRVNRISIRQNYHAIFRLDGQEI